MRRLPLTLAAVAALAVLAAGCGSHAPARTPVVVDTDLSTDDVVALLYLARRDDVELRAVAVSGTGLVRCPAGARLALDLLAVAGRPDVPVACGASAPSTGDNQFPPEWRDGADRLFGLVLPRSARAPDKGGGVELLHRAIEGARGKTALLSLAPFTDIASLLRRHHEVVNRLAGIWAMAGAVGVPGNIGAGHERVEWNAWIDPAAARAVLAGPVPVTLVPLDATNGAPITVELAARFQRHHYASTAGTVVWDLLASSGIYRGGQYLWDPVAATALTDPQALTFAEKRLRVVTAAGADQGRTVESPAGSPTRVAMRLDGAAFEETLLRTLLGSVPPAAREARPQAAIVYDGRTVRYRGPSRSGAGQGLVETVNHGGRMLSVTAGTLLEGRTLADLRALVHGLRGPFRAPSWFSTELSGETPPRSRMTWLFAIEPGTKAIVATVDGRPGAFVLGPVEAVAAAQ